MKKLKLYLTIFSVGLIIYGCDKPAPTQLVEDPQNTEDPFSVELITSDISDAENNGYDSTGVTDDLSRFTNVIVLSGIKITNRFSTFKSSLAFAVFFDKSKPFYSPQGKLIGYATRALGNVSFDGNKTRLLPFIKKYRNNNLSADTTFGLFHYLYSGRNNEFDPFRFKYNSNVKFRLEPFIGVPTEFNIPTPPEITGKVESQGKKEDNNLKFLLEWNASSGTKLEIILGVRVKGKDKVVPLYKIRTRDDGYLKIPANLLKALPSNRFDRIAVSFIRKYEGHESENGNDLYVLSQCIHTIIIENI